jgi:CheY-like chemotaxis protein/anti-sigma regulatory factor (Ser/Thr protein kinase)
VKPECAPIDVTKLFIWLEQNFEPLAREKQIGFKLHFPLRESLYVNSDLGLIKSVLMNFVSNAIKFTPQGAVLVSARRRGDSVLFQIWDTGIGIHDDDLKLIFDEFYQINNPQRDRNSGLGLGLVIAKRALNLLGAKVSCHSRVGRGSVFEFQLPIVQMLPEQVHTSISSHLPEPIGVQAFIQGKHFVVVEDDKLVAQAIASLIDGAGGSVVCFHRAEDALQQIDGLATHYYIVDYMLGSSLNGIELLKQLRQKIGRPLNAVLVTGDTSPAFINDAAEFPWPVLHKPVDIKKLIAALECAT